MGTDRVEVRVVFTIPPDGDVPSYTDALIYDVIEYAALPDGRVESDKRARYAAWRAHLDESPAAAPIGEVEEQHPAARAADLARQAATLAGQAAEAAGQVAPGQVTGHRMRQVRGPGAPKIRGGALYRCSCNGWSTLATDTKAAARAHADHKRAETAAAEAAAAPPE